MGRFWAIVLGIGICLSFAFGPSAHALEMDVHAHMLWHYEWYGQKGTQAVFSVRITLITEGGRGLQTSIFGTEGSSTPTSPQAPQAGWSFFEVDIRTYLSRQPGD